jgi:uncharacterized protein
MTILLPATLATAAACALLAVWLGVRVSQVRVKHKVLVGDGGDPLVLARMRAHANFVEYAPFVLILLGLIELAKGPAVHLWAYGAVFVLARVAHGIGMERSRAGRMIGILVTWALLLLLIGEAAWTSWQGARPIGGDAITVEEIPAA